MVYLSSLMAYHDVVVGITPEKRDLNFESWTLKVKVWTLKVKVWILKVKVRILKGGVWILKLRI